MSGFEGIEDDGSYHNMDDSQLKKALMGDSEWSESDGSSEEEPSEDMKDYFNDLESELQRTKVEPVRERKNVSSKEELLEEQLKEPLNIDYTVFKNLLKSVENESWAGCGPASTLLKSVKM
ncbi:Hypothetical protein FKW44_019007 [Caligus rogercresseyi]|uniref:Uncharacterized protein n=1 Tax=Caligus rogercresseyi TaxID=217165 RepID=A0A7T8GVE4_CALRO|nr:Hypothetical protein FKW44_019007 [Caligus rogercresseyi]